MIVDYSAVYPDGAARERFARLAEKLTGRGAAPERIRYFTAPGRSELSGNHTDHQHGCVLAAAVDVDTIAAAAENGLDRIRLESEGFGACSVYVDPAKNAPAAPGSVESLLCGMAAVFAPLCTLRGVDLCVSSTVLPGSGLSSSAAFEVLLAEIFNELFCGGRLDALRLAELGQRVENDYFGKPCGRLDQTASAVGGATFMDFADPEHPKVEKLPLDLAREGYALCIINCGAGHADLTDEYAAIPRELGALCARFGKKVLAELPEEDFLAAVPRLRAELGDRVVLRAIHIYGENRRVLAQREALGRGDFAAFLRLVTASGLSSWRYLQNISPSGSVQEQPMAVALALTERALEGEGACRIQGGGFAGTLEAFVPLAHLEDFTARMEAWLGAGCCAVRTVRAVGAAELRL